MSSTFFISRVHLKVPKSISETLHKVGFNIILPPRWWSVVTAAVVTVAWRWEGGPAWRGRWGCPTWGSCTGQPGWTRSLTTQTAALHHPTAVSWTPLFHPPSAPSQARHPHSHHKTVNSAIIIQLSEYNKMQSGNLLDLDTRPTFLLWWFPKFCNKMFPAFFHENLVKLDSQWQL